MENYIFASTNEPANAGFFMVKPRIGDWEAIQDIVRQRHLAAVHQRNKELFDQVKGWGHEIIPPDCWESRRERGRYWNFTFAYSDQGLLYHWVKYVKKNVSMQVGARIEHWTTTTKGILYISNTTYNQLLPYERPIVHDRPSCSNWACDWSHFTGRQKPWLFEVPKSILSNVTHDPSTARELWFTTLRGLDRDYNLGINFANFTIGRPTLGSWATYGAVRTRAKKEIRASKLQNKTIVR